MSHTVSKYQLSFGDVTQVRMPLHAQILKIDVQFEQLFLWALVDEEQEVSEVRTFYLTGTGEEMREACTFGKSADHLKHRATVLTKGGSNVWHIFEVMPDKSVELPFNGEMP